MIKLFAIILMVLDHFALVLLTDNPVLCGAFRLLGRLSMPLYAYCIARGCYYSCNHKTFCNYLRNLLILAFISQLPYSMMYGGGLFSELNVVFTWFLSASFIVFFIVCRDYYTKSANFLLFAIWCILTVYANFTIGLEYGFYGVFTPIIMYCCYSKCFSGERKEPPYWTVLALAVAWAEYNYLESDGLQLPQLVMVFAVPLISFLMPHDGKVKIPKWLGYVCYPMSMIPFLLIGSLLKK